MEHMRLGRTGLQVSRSGFGCIPIQRLSESDAVALVRKAYDNGINFFDTARGYSDSEEKLGKAFTGIRDNVIIATKTHAADAEHFFIDLETSLRNLRSDYIDIYQLHNPRSAPDASDELMQAMQKAKEQGKIRFIGVTSHTIATAKEEVSSNLFDTMQFPLSCLSDENDMALATLCREFDVGLIAMKAMSGGLITSPNGSFAFLRSFGNIVPIWGMQHEWELDQFIALEANPPVLDEAIWQQINKDRAELGGGFCRRCGYCVPTCPAGISINMMARISLLMRRSVATNFTGAKTRADMEKIKDCKHCGECTSHCPYDLDAPALLEREYAWYQDYMSKL